MRYLLLLTETESWDPDDDALPESMVEYDAFTEECMRRGVFVAASPLQPPHTAKTVRVRDEQRLVVDGPFAEAREHIGGYYLLDCETEEEALELAALCPAARDASVEVRALWTLPGRHTRSAGGLGAE